VPPGDSSTPNRGAFDKKAREVANTAQANLIKGVDPAQVQKESYTALGLSGPPPTDLGNRRRADFIPDEAAEVFSLKPGEVTQVETGAQNYVVYKVIARDVTPEDQIKQEVSQQIYQQKFRQAMKSVLDAAPVEYDEQYLKPESPAPSTKASMSNSSSASAH
jgi:parvulin-like peptidyl-prolyl isomerase